MNKPGTDAVLDAAVARALELTRRYEETWDTQDLGAAILVWTELAQHEGLVGGHPSRHMDVLSNRSVLLVQRYFAAGRSADLDQALASWDRALTLAAPGSSDELTLLTNLGSGLRVRYGRDGAAADLERMIEVFEEVAARTADGDPERPGRLSNLGVGLETRYDHSGEPADLQRATRFYAEAVRATPAEHPERPGFLSNSARASYIHHLRTGDDSSLARAIDSYDEALETAPEQHPERPDYLTGLGIALRLQYERSGDDAALQRCITVLDEALDRVPPGSPRHTDCLDGLGNALRTRYYRTGSLDDLDRAIGMYESAVAETPPHAPGQAVHLQNLGIALQDRYARTRDRRDLEASVRANDEAVLRSPADAPERSGRLANLANSLMERFARDGDSGDVDRATVLAEEAAAVRPGEPPQPGFLTTLGSAHLCRHDLTGDPSDLSAAVNACQSAVDGLSERSPQGVVWQVPQPVERLVPEFRGEEIRDGGEESRGPVEVGADGGPNASRRQEPAPAEPRPRYLRAQLPERVETGRPLSLVVAITLAPREGATGPLETFVVPPEGATVTILVSSPGLVPRGDMEQDIHVPADQDSKPHRFSFLAGAVGLHPVTVEAYRGGTHLGTVLLEVSVEADATVTEGPVRVAELTSVAFEPGEVTLQVNRGPNGYTFQLLGDPICLPVTGGVMGDAGTVVSQIVAELRDMAANRSKYASSQLVRDRLLSLGVELWAAAVPEAVQLQFWAQAERIRSFTIAADQDTIPWELLYPMNGTNDNGFLADQFPVVRRAYAARRVTTLPMGSAAYVVPPKPPENALDEVAAIRDRLGIRVDNRGVLSELSAVRQLMLDSPGVLHFACHNTFTDAEGSSIKLGGGPWKPGDLSVAIQKTALAAARPLVFFNACRSAGETEWFSQMSGWAKNFVKAGAGAFIGSLWAVRSSSARTFAEAFYEQFADNGEPLGSSSLHARRAIAEDGGDPTWLAYTVYGNPAAVAAR